MTITPHKSRIKMQKLSIGGYLAGANIWLTGIIVKITKNRGQADTGNKLLFGPTW